MTGFGAKSTADEVLDGVDLSGRVVVVTGANTGIGFETARALAAAGARVHLACRDREKGRAAATRIERAHPASQVEVGELDLGSLASVRAYTSSFSAAKLDVLLCNAGLVANRFETTADGIERTVGVSHVGHFELFWGLRDRMAAAGRSRLVVVSSESHRSPRQLDFERFPMAREQYSMLKAYGQAKLCNVLFAAEVARRCADDGITTASLHPGSLIPTEIGRGSALSRVLIALAKPFTKSLEQGAATSVYCASAPEISKLGGYYSDCAPKAASAEAQNAQVAARLWSATEALIDLRNAR